MAIIGTWQTMDLDSFTISIPYAVVKEHDSQQLTSIPIHLVMHPGPCKVEKTQDPNHET
jgi:hypothetical protein